MQAWPQAGGPDGSWHIKDGVAAKSWSVANNRGLCYKQALPSGGQGGIAVWGDRLFLMTFPEGQTPSADARNAVGHAIDANTGEIEWSVPLRGSAGGPTMYAFSDVTSHTPITDGEHVWFYNSGGQMGAWDMEGNEVWKRNFTPSTSGKPFNKQFEPFLVGDVVVNMEVAGNNDWNYLRGINKLTGEVVWTSEAALTHYSTPIRGMHNGKPATAFGRGARHNVPEGPHGITLASLDPADAGKTLWETNASGYEAMFTVFFDDQYLYRFAKNNTTAHVVFDVNTGEMLRRQSLENQADVTEWAGDAYRRRESVNPGNVYPMWSANIVAFGYHYFMTMTDSGRDGGDEGPPYSIGRVNVETGKVEYLEMPLGVRPNGQRVYRQNVGTVVEDSQGRKLNQEGRSATHGFGIGAFFGNPTIVGSTLYYTGMLGVTYAVDASAVVFDENALLGVSDLGPLGQTWSLNSISYSRGRLYHRTSKEIICIEAPEVAQ